MIKTLPFDLLSILIICLISVIIGKKLLSWFKFDAILSGSYLFSFGVGISLMIFLTFTLGHLGLLHKKLFLIFFALIILLNYKVTKNVIDYSAGKFYSLICQIKNYPLINSILIVILFSNLTFNFLYNYAPPTADDELIYQISLPKYYHDNHKIIARPDNFSSYYPQYGQLLLTLAMVVGSPLSAKLMVYFIGLFLLLILYNFSKRYTSKETALLTTTIFYTMPIITSLTGITSADIINIFFLLLSVYAFFNWTEAIQEQKWFYLSAFFSGISLGTRPHSYSTVGALILFIFIFLIFYKKLEIKTCFSKIILYCLIVFACFSPWLIRNLILTGNPVYPLKLIGKAGDVFFSMMMKFRVTDKNLLTFLYEFSTKPIIWSCGVIITAFAPINLFFRNNSFSKQIFVLSTFILLVVFIMFVPEQRYYLLSFPLLSICAASSITLIINKASLLWKKIIYVVIILALLFPNFIFSFYWGSKRIPLFIGKESVDSYLFREHTVLETYHIAKYINENIPRNKNILFLGTVWAPQYYYKHNKTIGMGGYSPEFFGWDIREVTNRLRRDNIHYFVLLRKDLKKDTDDNFYYTYLYQPPGMLISWFNKRNIKKFNLLYEKNGIEVYEIK